MSLFACMELVNAGSAQIVPTCQEPSSSSIPSSSSAEQSSSSVVVSSSSSVSIQTGVIYGTPVTYEDETYQTVVIGTQTWMARNLNYNAEGSKCYDDDPANCATYGRLYNWETAKTVCPEGWHLPSNVEWGTLMQSINPSCSLTGNCAGAGKYLKAAEGWSGVSGNGTDAYGFAALPGGYGSSSDSFYNVGYWGYWWSITEYDAYAYYREMGYDSDGVKSDMTLDNLYSVRCVKD
jgi:uncharacterized protein (TIGR02145 family)